MRLHRFYVSVPVGTSLVYPLQEEKIVHQIRHVLRLGVGDEMIIFDGSGSDWLCRIEKMEKKSAELLIKEVRRSSFLPTREITLLAALIKKDNFEWIVEKATELGVTKIVPILSERSEKKSVNHDRLLKIAIEASEQCGRGNIPIIDDQKKITDVMNDALVFHTTGEKFVSGNFHNSESIKILIGPEGGWSDKEIELFHKNKNRIYCLGPQVLRAETAVVATLAQFVF